MGLRSWWTKRVEAKAELARQREEREAIRLKEKQAQIAAFDPVWDFVNEKVRLSNSDLYNRSFEWMVSKVGSKNDYTGDYHNYTERWIRVTGETDGSVRCLKADEEYAGHYQGASIGTYYSLYRTTALFDEKMTAAAAIVWLKEEIGKEIKARYAGVLED